MSSVRFAGTTVFLSAVALFFSATSSAALQQSAASPAASTPAPGAPAATTAPETTRPATPAATPVTAGWQDGFILQSANGDYRLGLGLLTQIDGRFSVDATKPITNTFTIRKARPIFAGRVAKYFDYRFVPDIGNGTTVLWTRTSTCGSPRNSASERARTRRRSATSC